MGTLPLDHLPFRDIEPVDYMSYGETLQWLYNTAGACHERSSRHLEFQLSREQVLVNLP